MISAQEAREKTRYVHGDQLKIWTGKCEAEIQKAIARAESRATLSTQGCLCPTQLLDVLKAQGYEATHHHDQRDGDFLEIKW